MNLELDWSVIDAEIIETFHQMDPCKALGIDGILDLFYKKNWSVVGQNVILFCKDVLNGTRSVADVNDTMVVLIPKVKDPVNMTQYRPISLCRVIYKIISKVIANKLKPLLSICISDN